MKINYKIICFVILAIFHSSCNDKCEIKGIEVSDLLSTVSKEKYHINYCDLLESALNGEDKDIEKISLLHFGDGTSYDHGEVLIHLIYNIGEDKYLNAIKNVSKQDRKRLNSYFESGLLYGDLFYGKNLDSVFPKLSKFLQNE